MLGVLIFFLALMQGNRRDIIFTAFAFIFVVAAAISGRVNWIIMSMLKMGIAILFPSMIGLI